MCVCVCVRSKFSLSNTTTFINNYSAWLHHFSGMLQKSHLLVGLIVEEFIVLLFLQIAGLHMSVFDDLVIQVFQIKFIPEFIHAPIMEAFVSTYGV